MSIPRHQIETNAADYVRMVRALFGHRDPRTTIREFEFRFAEFVGCRNAIAVSSGRSALRRVLKALKFPPGSEVIIPAYNYFAVVEEFLSLGLRPVFADIRATDLNVNSQALEPLVTERTRAVLATHMFGHPCRMDDLGSFAERHKLILLEDCAHAFGSRFRGHQVGTFGRAGVFSLSVMKLITAFGGGVITTNDDELAETIRVDLSRHPKRVNAWHGWRRFAKGMLLDFGTRQVPFRILVRPVLRLARAIKPNLQQRWMTEVPRRIMADRNHQPPPLHPFQTALGMSQLRKAAQLIERRREVSLELDRELSSPSQGDPDALRAGILNTVGSIDERSVLGGERTRFNGMYYGVLVDDPVGLSRHLFARGIDSESAEYRNCADLEIYGEFQRDCPVARSVERRILRIPNHPRLRNSDVRRIAREIHTFLQRSTRTNPNDRQASAGAASPTNLQCPAQESRTEPSGPVFAGYSHLGHERRPGPRIRPAELTDIGRLVAIHTRSLPNDFLVQLGLGFLTDVFFPTLLTSGRVRTYVAELDGRVSGFLVTRVGLDGVLWEVLRNRPIRLVHHVSRALAGRPSLLRTAVSVLRQLRSRGRGAKESSVAELFLMAVDPTDRRRGVGGALIEHSAAMLKGIGVTSYRVLLHAENFPANGLYHHAGFHDRAIHDFAGIAWRERERRLSVCV